MKQYLEAGEFVTTHGVRGELKLYPWSDTPEFAASLPRLFFSPAGGHEKKIEAARVHKGMCLVKLQGVDSIEAARPYVRRVAYFSRADVVLPAGRFFVQDILGCTVRDADTGEEYGMIAAVERPAGTDIYTIRNAAGKTFLFPAVPEFLTALDPAGGVVTVRPIPGMFTDEGGNADVD